MTDPSSQNHACAGPPVRAILFDVDGTLVDTNDLHTAAWRETFLAFGADVPFDAIRSQIGKGGDNLVPTLLPEVDDARRKEMEAHRGDLFQRDYLPRAVPFDGVRALFLRLAQNKVRIVLASSAHQAEIDYYLSALAVEDLVEAVTTADDVEHSKPCPDIFAAALAKVAPHGADEVFVVGDSPWDVKAAGKLGIRTIGFRSGGFPDDTLTEAGACALYDGPADLLARFDSSPLARA
jgi:HAD superfamily hydrolase (TIGR01509 family)